MSTSNIPKIDSVEALARFWDCHDITDFEEQLEEVPEPVFERETTVRVHLPCKEAETLKEIAESRGLHDGDLIRQWVLERVHAS